MLAMLVAGYMAKQRSEADAPATASRRGGLGGLLDLDGDGNPLDDILGRFIR
jgi:hypothetical protein